MERCAMSPFIKEKKDYFVGIYDRAGRIVASHISASGPGMIAPIRATYPIESMRPGDAYWFNDPTLPPCATSSGSSPHLGASLKLEDCSRIVRSIVISCSCDRLRFGGRHDRNASSAGSHLLDSPR